MLRNLNQTMVLPAVTEMTEHLAVILPQVLLALASVLLAEIVRDLFHLAGHYWQPLQVGHNLHHKAYKSDLSKVSMEAYCKAQWHNDVPEATVMVLVTAMVAAIEYSLGQGYALAFGSLYSLGFLVTSLGRANGRLLFTDLTHEPGDLVTNPSQWIVNRTYHWRHHFDRGEAYFCGTFTLVDKVMGTSLALKGKTIAITGASGALGRSMIAELTSKGAKVIALTTSPDASFEHVTEVLTWKLGAEAEWQERLQKIDILIVNHGISVGADRSTQAIQDSLEVNTLSAWRWLELFLNTVRSSKDRAIKEVWINTSEAEVNPAFSPLYELSKRMIGDLITLRRLDAPCVVRKLILGPFKSQLNPIGVMSPNWVAWAIVALAQRDFRDIIVTINPITYIVFPLKELVRSIYFRLFSKGKPH